MDPIRWTAVFLLMFSFTVIKVSSKFEFTNLNCTSLDPAFMDVPECFLKSANRTYKYMTIKTKFYKLPIDNVMIRVKVLKRLNGYKPFLYDFNFDGCKFLKGKQNQLIQFFYEMFAPYSNLNHSCPYNHDVYVDKLPISYLDHRVTVLLPVPEGDYCIHSIFSIGRKDKFDLKVYCQIS
ncbi:uncharacterized protein LOC122818176 [Drosophila biarmipes]|uniref:uncharacterized protein LOC122818176 n=1 Tax=Drosophila biarmipes TaxID=125945 RepID=UPI001CDA85B2|nr:uncharacterized protein LOC122818176 [Drosophila biarmipes]